MRPGNRRSAPVRRPLIANPVSPRDRALPSLGNSDCESGARVTTIWPLSRTNLLRNLSADRFDITPDQIAEDSPQSPEPPRARAPANDEWLVHPLLPGIVRRSLDKE